MASNTITPPTNAGPLSFMTKISRDVYHFRPPPNPPSSPDPNAPKFILICSWMAAREMHIAKYLQPYQAMYPSSEILLVRSEMRQFLRPQRTLVDLAEHAIPVIRAAFPDSEPDSKTDSTTSLKDNTKPQMLVHLFSGGGSFIFSRIRNLMATSSGTSALPPHTVVYDSAPPQFHYKGSYLATVGGWTTTMRRLLWPMVHLMCMWWWITHRVTDRRRGGPLARIAALHNEREGRANTEVRRTYIYGPGDVLVKWRDIEWHAKDAAKRGFKVRLERFEGSAHVQHVRVDEDRYWRVARETWEG